MRLPDALVALGTLDPQRLLLELTEGEREAVLTFVCTHRPDLFTALSDAYEAEDGLAFRLAAEGLCAWFNVVWHRQVTAAYSATPDDVREKYAAQPVTEETFSAVRASADRARMYRIVDRHRGRNDRVHRVHLRHAGGRGTRAGRRNVRGRALAAHGPPRSADDPSPEPDLAAAPLGGAR